MNQTDRIQELVNEQIELNREIYRLKKSLESIPLAEIERCDKVMEKLVMCQDCIHKGEQSRHGGDWYWCDRFEVWVDDDDFCSMGKEKTSESDLLTESFFTDLPTKMDALFDIHKVREED